MNEIKDVAAVDLGSNSFHMLVAREDNGKLQVLDRLRETVRLASGLNENGGLSEDVQNRAVDCLARFGQRLRGIEPGRVRVVGTNTLRRLNDEGEFLAKAERALQHEIEVISGVEEARLVYGGVVRGQGDLPPKRLVVDIGGSSTELIIGNGLEPRLMESVGLGCVTHTKRYFSDGAISRSRIRQARLAACVELEFLQRKFRRRGWDVAVGASGTVRGAWRVMMGQGWIDEVVTRAALEKTLAMLADTGKISKVNYPGLREDRRPVFVGGVTVLAAVFDTLGLKEMRTSDLALREGVVYDLLGRLRDADVRISSVASLARRYGVDQRQARDVQRTSLRLLDAVVAEWKLPKPEVARLLSWASSLHEIGLAIAHDGYARHGEYILRHADLFGFSQTDQKMLATLIRLQRGKVMGSIFKGLPGSHADMVRAAAAILRVAIALHRSRTPRLRLPFSVTAKRRGLRLEFPERWLARHPLTQTDLDGQREHLKQLGFRLDIA